MPITLPTAPSPAEGQAPRIMILYGPPKVGKTTLLSAIPGALILDLEDGSDFVSAMKLKLQNPLQIKSFVDEVAKAKQPYPIVAIETLDRLEMWAEAEATRQYKASIQGKNFNEDSVLSLPKGGGYYYLRNVFYNFFITLCTSAKYVIFTGHVKDKMLTIDSKDVTAADLDLTGKIRNIVCAYSDAIGHVYRDKDGKLSISFKTTETMQCGSRCEHLRGKVFDFATPPTKENWKQIYTFL
jgi:hypothetical protein